MSTHLRELLMGELGTLRHEPSQKRIRAVLGGRTVVDTRRALLVWEPRRVVPVYAGPAEDIDAELMPAPDGPGPAEISMPQLAGRPVLDPSIPFTVHSAAGEPLVLRSGEAQAAAFRPADEALAGHILLDFSGFDAW